MWSGVDYIFYNLMTVDMDIYYLEGRLIILFSLGKTADGERLPEYVLYGGDDPADDLAGGDDPAVLAGAGLGQPSPTGPSSPSNLCPADTEGCSVLTGAGGRALALPTGRDTKLSCGLLGNLAWPEGLPTGAAADIGHRLLSSAGVALQLNGELELLAVSAAADIGGLSITGVQSVSENPLLQQGVVPDGVPDVGQKPPSSPISQAPGPLTRHPIQHSSQGRKQAALRFTVAPAQQA